jgi:3'-phosphoadenosine 5'-phosphosulfate sulfotransferase (PAPS reductase)/FAD synthetase
VITPDGRTIERFVVGFSGGKDSLAAALLCRELGPTTLLHADTGWEHPGHHDYVRAAAASLGLPLIVVRGRHGGMADLVRHKRMFPTRLRRFCTVELKIKPIAAYLAEQEDEVVSVIGVRREESAARAKLDEWSHFDEGDCWTWRPLLDWPLAQVLGRLREAGAELHPHYHEGASRVGCYPCIYARKAEIAALPDWRVQEIAALEREIEAGAKDGGTRAFFQCKDPINTSGTAFVPVERVVEWARTSRGGREMLLPIPVAAPCVAWGLCERPVT